MFVLGRPFQFSLIFAIKAEPTRVKHFEVALLTNNRELWKGLLWTNTPAYYKLSYITEINFFITLGPVASIIKLLTSVN